MKEMKTGAWDDKEKEQSLNEVKGKIYGLPLRP